MDEQQIEAIRLEASKNDYAYYVVKYGFNTGIYTSVEDMLQQIAKYNRPVFWMCHTELQAELYLNPNLRYKWRLSEQEFDSCRIPTYKKRQHNISYDTTSKRSLFLINERSFSSPPQILVPDT
jgi:viroplasmin and RNaseH domain-containing protein